VGGDVGVSRAVLEIRTVFWILWVHLKISLRASDKPNFKRFSMLTKTLSLNRGVIQISCG